MEVSTSEIFTSTLLVPVCTLGLHKFSHLPACHSFGMWQNTEWLDTPAWRLRGEKVGLVDDKRPQLALMFGLVCGV